MTDVSLYVHVLSIYSEDYVCLLSSDTSTLGGLGPPLQICTHDVLLMRRGDRGLVLATASIVTSQTKDRIIVITAPQGGTPYARAHMLRLIIM